MKRKIAIVFALLCSSPAFAQTCPQGISPAGNPSCIPPTPAGGDEGFESSAPRPLGRWHTTYGSFFWDMDSGYNSLSIGKRSKREARRIAKGMCVQSGAKNCKEFLLIDNECGAVVAGPRHLFSRVGPREDENRSAAIELCQKRSPGAVCKVVYSGCSDSVFEYY